MSYNKLNAKVRVLRKELFILKKSCVAVMKHNEELQAKHLESMT